MGHVVDWMVRLSILPVSWLFFQFIIAQCNRSDTKRTKEERFMVSWLVNLGPIMIPQLQPDHQRQGRGSR